MTMPRPYPNSPASTCRKPTWTPCVHRPLWTIWKPAPMRLERPPSDGSCKPDGRRLTSNWPPSRARHSPPHSLKADGHQSIKVASRFGTLWLSRQVLAVACGEHLLPGNALLPAHEGMIITRGLQEWACLLPQDLPFAPVARLL